MPTLNIEGRNVQVDDGFLSLSRDQQNATVEEIAKSFAPQPKLSDAVTDIPNEIGNAASEAITNLKGVANRGQQGPIEGLLNTGKAAMAIPQLLASPITGAVRSLIGHPMAQAEHAVGTVIAPEIAAKDNPQKMYETAKGDVDTAMQGLGARELPVVAPKAPVPSIKELKAGASANYESPALVGLEVKPASIGDFATKAKVNLNAGGIDENLAPKTFAILSKLEKVPDSPAAVFTGNNIKSLRQLLGNAAGEPGKEGLAASKALNALDEHIPAIEPKDVIAGDPKAAGEALDTANADYSAAKHAETIDNKTIRAELRASAVNSGHNVANTIRQRMADLLNPERPDLQRGFRPDELAMMERIVRGTKTQNALRTAANYTGKLQGTAIGGVVGSMFGPAGAAVGAAIPSAVSFAMKSLANKLTLGDVAKVSEMIRSRAPLASSMQKFDESAGQFTGTPSARSYAAALIAARNFSTNLRGAGINVSPSDLLKGLQSPTPANANDQQ